MARFLADENVTQEVVDAARQAGHDLKWIKEMQPGIDDDTVAFHRRAGGQLRIIPLP